MTARQGNLAGKIPQSYTILVDMTGFKNLCYPSYSKHVNLLCLLKKIFKLAKCGRKQCQSINLNTTAEQDNQSSLYSLSLQGEIFSPYGGIRVGCSRTQNDLLMDECFRILYLLISWVHYITEFAIAKCKKRNAEQGNWIKTFKGSHLYMLLQSMHIRHGREMHQKNKKAHSGRDFPTEKKKICWPSRVVLQTSR